MPMGAFGEELKVLGTEAWHRSVHLPGIMGSDFSML